MLQTLEATEYDKNRSDLHREHHLGKILEIANNQINFYRNTYDAGNLNLSLV